MTNTRIESQLTLFGFARWAFLFFGFVFAAFEIGLYFARVELGVYYPLAMVGVGAICIVFWFVFLLDVTGKQCIEVFRAELVVKRYILGICYRTCRYRKDDFCKIYHRTVTAGVTSIKTGANTPFEQSYVLPESVTRYFLTHHKDWRHNLFVFIEKESDLPAKLAEFESLFSLPVIDNPEVPRDYELDEARKYQGGNYKITRSEEGDIRLVNRAPQFTSTLFSTIVLVLLVMDVMPLEGVVGLVGFFSFRFMKEEMTIGRDCIWSRAHIFSFLDKEVEIDLKEVARVTPLKGDFYASVEVCMNSGELHKLPVGMHCGFFVPGMSTMNIHDAIWFCKLVEVRVEAAKREMPIE